MTTKSTRIVAFSALLAPAMLLSCALGAAKSVDFNHDVRPILASNCLKCHGLDEGARKSKLRLDVREIATGPAKSGKHAIVPGHPEQSELVRRIFSKDADEVMPLASSHLVLSEAQKEVLRHWIAQGATYEPHWAFVAPRQAALPHVRQTDWPHNAIDYFVLAKLEAEGLHPSPEADRYTLVRRLYLDLIGLPPTPEEADEFVNDPAPDAYERLVDKLLASPHYGERWARRWLDLARYADTNGFEKDRPRSIWPYRDWVIEALSADMPFDEFTIEQLAGDMLPGATPRQKIATGFHRNTMLNEEGGIDPLEYRFRATVDRINTTSTVWLGLTVRCAQCHTHKYDPITHKEYYRLMALLNNADEPEMQVADEKIAAERAKVETKIAALEADLANKFPPNDVKWETPSATVSTASGSTPEKADDGSWRFTGPSPERDTYTFEFESAAPGVDRIRLEALKDDVVGPGRTPLGNFVLTGISISVAPKDSPDQFQPLKLVKAEADFSQPGFPVEHALDGAPRNGWAVDPGNKTPITEHAATFFFDKPVSHGARYVVKLDQQYGKQHTISHLRLSLGRAIRDERPLEVRRADALEKALAVWEKRESGKAVEWTVLRPDEMRSTMPILTLLDDNSVLASGDITKSDTYDLTFHPELSGITAVRLEALPDQSLPHGGPGMVYYEGPFGDFFLSEISLQADGKIAKFDKAFQSFAAPGFPASKAIDGDPQTGWRIDGGQGKAHVAVFTLAEPVADARELKLRMLFERYHAAPLGHFRISVTTDPRARESSALPPEVEEALAIPADDRSDAQRDVLRRYFLSIAPELASARNQIDRLRESMPQLPTTLVMKERPAGHARPTYVHHRGEFLQREEQVDGGVPTFLPPMPKDALANRLTFARWLVSTDNPLTARVTVNRQWQAFFGRGIVRTLEDFGYQGEPPTNQALLDWLAVEFMKQGWSMKKLDRLIVLSSTYRQSSRVTPELLARDPQNLLLARGPRFRMEAEIIRDAALRTAGLLSEKIGGPSVFPPQPASVTTEGAYGPLTWKASTGEDRFRRSIYTFSKRTAPFALYNTFDAPTGEECLARREVSNTPLQALSVLNDTIFVEAAQALGKTYGQSHDSDEARVERLFRRVLVRPPDDDERRMLTDFARRQRQRFAEDRPGAEKLAATTDADAVERAAWTAVARSILNLDETVTKE